MHHGSSFVTSGIHVVSELSVTFYFQNLYSVEREKERAEMRHLPVQYFVPGFPEENQEHLGVVLSDNY
jgi:hypothetical protein